MNNMVDNKLHAFCSTCGVQVELNEAGSYTNSRPADGNIAPLDPTDTPYNHEEYVLCNCTKCQSPFLFKREWWELPAFAEIPTSDPELLYPSTSKFPLSSLPQIVAKPYQNAVRSYEAGLYEPCVIMCRKCLEAVCQAHDISRGNLKKKLEALRDRKIIDSKLHAWTDGLRLIANDAAHDLEIDLNAQDASDALEFVEAILSYVFLLVRKFQEFEARRTGGPSEK